MHYFGHVYIDIYTHSFPMIFQSFQIFLAYIILYCLLKTYCYIFDLQFIYLSLEVTDLLLFTFKENLFFNFSYKLFHISPYLRALDNFGCQ